MSLYDQFIINFHMNKLDSTISELINMLVATEKTLKSSRGTVLAVEWTSSSKRKSSWKKNKSTKKQKKESKPMKDALKKAAVKEKYFHYDTDGHWRRNCLLYLESLKTKKGDTPLEDMLSLLVIKSNLIVFLLLVGYWTLILILIMYFNVRSNRK